MTTESREVRLRSRPSAMPSAENFELATVQVPAPGPDEVQVRNTWMSVDPYMRGRMRDVRSYVPPFLLGEPLQGVAVGTVVQSNSADFSAGDTVLSPFGWREVFNIASPRAGQSLAAGSLMKLPGGGMAPELFLGAAGLTGLTAYIGLLDIAGVNPGETVFVSGAAGAVGSIACQISKLKGATVIGSAGGEEKCAWLRSVGVDHTIDYKAEPDLTAALARTAPQGIDVYFDNVGGPHLDAALLAAKPYARFALCGAIEGYNGVATPICNLGVSIGKKLRLQGFIVSDYFGDNARFLADMLPWIESGKIKSEQTVDYGIENAAGAFLKLFSGANLGKMLVKL